MEFIIIPTEELKKIDAEWEHRRKSNDGTKAIIHKVIYDRLVPEEKKPQPKMMRARMAAPMAAPEPEMPEERVYPYPLATGDQINEMEEFKSEETPLQ